MRRAAKRDDNEKRIVEFLRRCGYTVAHLNDPGIPDLLVGTPYGINLLLEVKGEKGKLTEPQHAFFDMWPGQATVVRTIKDAKETLRRIMPVYLYVCAACDKTTDIVQKFTDEPITICPFCGKPEMKRKIQIAAVIYNGNGWTGAAKDKRA